MSLRIPKGLHRQSGPALAAPGAGRIQVTDPLAYWHQTAVELFAWTPPVTISANGQGASMVGPAGIGERWSVTQVSVQTSSGLAQATTAQVYQATAGQTQHLLGQTSFGGLDDLLISARVISQGEQIAVLWSTATPGDTAVAQLTGVKYVLEAS